MAQVVAGISLARSGGLSCGRKACVPGGTPILSEGANDGGRLSGIRYWMVARRFASPRNIFGLGLARTPWQAWIVSVGRAYYL
jgi:hypothetical protein